MTRSAPSPFRRRQRRLLILGIVLPAFAGATALALTALSRTQVYFYGPSALPSPQMLGDREVRLGGLVEKGSLSRGEGTTVSFTVSDGVAAVPVEFDGSLPALVAEGDGVIAQGTLNDQGIFIAETVLARHDENYMAPEVADALKATGEYEKYIESRRQ
ncbi:cytochrome c-type biogenesis transmembrane protein [Parvularcula bermudensis HTCC2503]|uniref:Cytochrome c-type biogenesis protein CcmE n=1 Tax=Parvularcula bermudensis (strain ATCC BAA-594 / HTCC2503 / KCTC 12087) TaxID=314260 RepID=E0TI59_PARBH|nr:cytochrome c maturation protein CcmE [Parvularcula bermudensis]ADM09398.1 cytochrome c-type biogenesis transmembrane protein [Parvularcula bermudensis HTCC2503]